MVITRVQPRKLQVQQDVAASAYAAVVAANGREHCMLRCLLHLPHIITTETRL